MNPFHHAILTAVQNSPSIYYDGEGKIGEFSAIHPGFTFMAGRNPFDGYYYYIMLGKGGAPINRSNFVFKLDRENLQILQEYQIPRPDVTSTYDEHLKGTINFDASGNIFVTMEVGSNTATLSDGHNTDILIYGTTTPGDLSTLTLSKRIDGYFAYPKLWIFGSNQYINARGTVNNLNLFSSTILKSVDSGATWMEHLMISLPTSIRAYTYAIHSDANEIVLALLARNDTNFAFESFSIMRSTDGITWSNWDNSYSKDTSVNGALTYVEIKANMLVFDVNPSINGINFLGGIVKGGEIKVLVVKTDIGGITVDGNVEQIFRDLRYYTYSGGWTYVDMSTVLVPDFYHVPPIHPTVQLVPEGRGESIYVIDRTDTSNCQVLRYKSGDSFVTYEGETIYEGEGNYYFGSHAFNEADEQVLFLTDIKGDMVDTNSYSNLRIIMP